jgi:hypothetical protein
MSKPVSGLPSRIRGYAKELVAEVIGDARLQEDGKVDIVRGNRVDAEPKNSVPHDPPMNGNTSDQSI